jgi:hypothetical protein
MVLAWYRMALAMNPEKTYGFHSREPNFDDFLTPF